MAADKGGQPDPMDEMRASLQQMWDQLAVNNQAVSDVQTVMSLMTPALASLAGLENVAAGVGQLVEVLAPLRNLGNPPEPPPQEVVDAIDSMKAALAVGLALATIDRLPVDDEPIAFIGEVSYGTYATRQRRHP